MHANVLTAPEDDRFGQGMAVALGLHALLLAAIVGFSLWHRSHTVIDAGEDASLKGAISASMVSAIPLPSKVPPVEKQVLASEDTSVAPVPPKEETIPPPKPTDVLVKAKTTPPKVAPKTAPVETEAPPKHPQPVAPTTKADYGNAASQLQTSTTPVGTSTASATILDKTMGQRFSYYGGIISRTVASKWYKGEADPRASADRAVTILFDVGVDGTPDNIRFETRSGSPTLDQSAMRAMQRIDAPFGPNPFGKTITIEFKFIY